MQNRYCGDVGDYGKYGLLRCLAAPVTANEKNFRLGVNWYLVPDETGNRDGKHTGYLSKLKEPQHRSCDPWLYDQLRAIVRQNLRTVQEIADRVILPGGTVFYNEVLTYDHLKGSKNERLAFRSHWVQQGYQQLRDCELVFFDPDNGLNVPSSSKHHKRGIKYVFYDEVVKYYERGQSLIIYNHRDRKPEFSYRERLRGLRRYIRKIPKLFFLRFTSYSVRDYIFVPQPGHLNLLKTKIEEMLAGAWSRHFQYYDLEPQDFTISSRNDGR